MFLMNIIFNLLSDRDSLMNVYMTERNMCEQNHNPSDKVLQVYRSVRSVLVFPGLRDSCKNIPTSLLLPRDQTYLSPPAVNFFTSFLHKLLLFLFVVLRRIFSAEIYFWLSGDLLPSTNLQQSHRKCFLLSCKVGDYQIYTNSRSSDVRPDISNW